MVSMGVDLAASPKSVSVTLEDGGLEVDMVGIDGSQHQFASKTGNYSVLDNHSVECPQDSNGCRSDYGRIESEQIYSEMYQKIIEAINGSLSSGKALFNELEVDKAEFARIPYKNNDENLSFGEAFIHYLDCGFGTRLKFFYRHRKDNQMQLAYYAPTKCSVGDWSLPYDVFRLACKLEADNQCIEGSSLRLKVGVYDIDLKDIKDPSLLSLISGVLTILK